MALKLLRPGGVLVLFGLILYPTVEDQVADEGGGRDPFMRVRKG